MKCFSVGVACALVAATIVARPISLGAAEDVYAKPAALVQAALKTELAGPSDQRAALLKQALDRDPNFAPARWQSGFIRFDNEWLKVDDVSRRARDDQNLATYRKKRDAMVDTADNHRELAAWCHKHKLPDEARIHWAKVLEFDPSDAEALAALGLQLYNGRLLTRKQIEQEKQRAGEQLRATRHWQPQIVKWRGAIERGNAKQLDEALRKLDALRDPAALPALESVLGVNLDSARQAVEFVADRNGRPHAAQRRHRAAIAAGAVCRIERGVRGGCRSDQEAADAHVCAPIDRGHAEQGPLTVSRNAATQRHGDTRA